MSHIVKKDFRKEVSNFLLFERIIFTMFQLSGRFSVFMRNHAGSVRGTKKEERKTKSQFSKVMTYELQRQKGNLWQVVIILFAVSYFSF
jgi:hypothetical protein